MADKEARGWGWEAVDDLDSEDEGDGRPLPSSTSVSNQQEQEEEPNKSITINTVSTGHTSGRRSSVDAIRTAIFSAFRGKSSEESNEAGNSHEGKVDWGEDAEERRGSD